MHILVAAMDQTTLRADQYMAGAAAASLMVAHRSMAVVLVDLPILASETLVGSASLADLAALVAMRAFLEWMELRQPALVEALKPAQKLAMARAVN